METLHQSQSISIQQGCPQSKLEICGGREYKAETDEFYRQVNAHLAEMFWQYVKMLVEKGWIDREEVYVNGTKIESKANRYTFVWRKTVERLLVKIRDRVRELLELESGYATKGKLRESIEELEEEISAEGLSALKGRGHHKPEKIRKRDEEKELLERWESYEQKKEILGEKRNSYSKTDPDATFMHMKDDHMRNGQLKPGYNVQFAVNSQFIVGLGVFADRTDYATLPPILNALKDHLGFCFEKVVADSGYESLENYRYLDENGQDAFIKPMNYETSKTKKFKGQIGRAENMAYFRQGKYYLCKDGRILAMVGTTTEHGKDGTTREVAKYRCEDCSNCPHRAACCKVKDPNNPKELSVCREFAQFREAALNRITTEEGKLLR